MVYLSGKQNSTFNTSGGPRGVEQTKITFESFNTPLTHSVYVTDSAHKHIHSRVVFELSQQLWETHSYTTSHTKTHTGGTVKSRVHCIKMVCVLFQLDEKSSRTIFISTAAKQVAAPNLMNCTMRKSSCAYFPGPGTTHTYSIIL